MPYVAILLLTLITTAASAHDFLWLEREWISDAEATMAANPQLAKSDDATQGKWKSIYGQMRWTFRDGILETIQTDGVPYSVPYFVRQLDGDRFEILLNDTEAHTTFEISRSKRGFCADLQLEQKAPGFPYIECFSPYAAQSLSMDSPVKLGLLKSVFHLDSPQLAECVPLKRSGCSRLFASEVEQRGSAPSCNPHPAGLSHARVLDLRRIRKPVDS
jgi:hypothetical protein